MIVVNGENTFGFSREFFYNTAKWPPGENGGQASTNRKEGLQHRAFRLLVGFG